MDYDDDDAFLYGDEPSASAAASAPAGHANSGSSAHGPKATMTVGHVEEDAFDDIYGENATSATSNQQLHTKGSESGSDPRTNTSSDKAANMVVQGNTGERHDDAGGEGDEEEEEDEDDDDDDFGVDIIMNAPQSTRSVDFRNPATKSGPLPNMVVSGMGMTPSNIARAVASVPSVQSSTTQTTSHAQASTPAANAVLAASEPRAQTPPLTVTSPEGAPVAPTVDTMTAPQLIKDINGDAQVVARPPSDLPIPRAPDSAPKIDLLAPPTLQNGQSVYDYDLKVLETSGQPWRRPGSDLSQWFNYGFDEISWKRYLRFRKGMTVGREKLMEMPAETRTLPADVAENLNLPPDVVAAPDPDQPAEKPEEVNGDGPSSSSDGVSGNMFGMTPEQMTQMMMQMSGGAMPSMDPQMMMQMMAATGMGQMGEMGGMPPMANLNAMQGMPGFPGQMNQGVPAMQMGQPAMEGMSMMPQNQMQNTGITPMQQTDEGNGPSQAEEANRDQMMSVPEAQPPQMQNISQQPQMYPNRNPVPGPFRGGPPFMRGRGGVPPRGFPAFRGRGLPTGPRNPGMMAGAPRMQPPVPGLPGGGRAPLPVRDRDRMSDAVNAGGALDYGSEDAAFSETQDDEPRSRERSRSRPNDTEPKREDEGPDVGRINSVIERAVSPERRGSESGSALRVKGSADVSRYSEEPEETSHLGTRSGSRSSTRERRSDRDREKDREREKEKEKDKDKEKEKHREHRSRGSDRARERHSRYDSRSRSPERRRESRKDGKEDKVKDAERRREEDRARLYGDEPSGGRTSKGSRSKEDGRR